MPMWSNYQEAIFSAFETKTDNLIISACPGSGKTTVLKEIYNRSNYNTLYLAFANANVLEAKEKMDETDSKRIMTLNSLGHRAILKARPDVKLNKYKVLKLIDTFFVGNGYWPKIKETSNKYALAKLVGLAKCFDPIGMSADVMEDIIDDYDLDTFPGIADDAMVIYEANLKSNKTIDFQDQLLFPVFEQLELPHYDLVLGDEWQDINPIQSLLVDRFLERNANTRFIFVGDKHQAIYAFRGARSNSLELSKNAFNCLELPLKLSYRCPQLIVKEAQKYFPDDIEGLPSASMGSVEYGKQGQQYNFNYKDLVLCRNNAPLIAMAYQLLRERVPCQVKGRDIGEGLINYVKRLDCYNLWELACAMKQDMQKTINLSKGKDEEKIARLQDKHDVIGIFIENTRGDTVDDLIANIAGLFNQNRGVVLSTIHKAKGLEANRVFQLQFDLMKPWQNSSDVAKEQQKNLAYVAVTRSKEELIYLA